MKSTYNHFVNPTMDSNRSTEIQLVAQPSRPASSASEDVEVPQNEMDNDANGHSLPPTDGGKHAWLCLFACFMLEAMIWGQPTSHTVCNCSVLTTSRLSSFLWCLPRLLQRQRLCWFEQHRRCRYLCHGKTIYLGRERLLMYDTGSHVHGHRNLVRNP